MGLVPPPSQAECSSQDEDSIFNKGEGSPRGSWRVSGLWELKGQVQISVPQVSGPQPFPSWTLTLLACPGKRGMNTKVATEAALCEEPEPGSPPNGDRRVGWIRGSC